MNELFKRTLTALSLLILFLTCIFQGWITPIILLVEIKAYHELSQCHPVQDLGWLLDWCLFFCLLLFSLFPTVHVFLLYTAWFMAWTGWVLGPCEAKEITEVVLHTCFIHLVSVMCVVQLGFIQSNQAQGFFLFPCLMVMVNDTAAYVLGKRWGRTALFKQSPNKTLEGYLGAVPCTVLVGGLLATLAGLEPRPCLIIALFASTVAPFAGFFTSALKRSQGIKDFGYWLPGHGGLVDRVDCQLFMAPFTFFILKEYSD